MLLPYEHVVVMLDLSDIRDEVTRYTLGPDGNVHSCDPESNADSLKRSCRLVGDIISRHSMIVGRVRLFLRDRRLL